MLTSLLMAFAMSQPHRELKGGWIVLRWPAVVGAQAYHIDYCGNGRNTPCSDWAINAQLICKGDWCEAAIVHPQSSGRQYQKDQRWQVRAWDGFRYTDTVGELRLLGDKTKPNDPNRPCELYPCP